jgi:hypothetical protein
MVDAGIARMMRVSTTDAECLLNGHACPSVAETLGAPAIHIQAYVDTGQAAVIFAEKLGVDPEAVEDLGMRLGKKGRIGLIIGMMMAR